MATTPIPPISHPRLEMFGTFAEAVFTTSAAMVAAAFKAPARPPRKRGGDTLRPGARTPLWNALVTELKPLLKEHGAKANLGRVLGVPRQTVSMWLSSRSRMPDAERTLQLIAWILAKQSGKPPS
jgi:hypothetical protein